MGGPGLAVHDQRTFGTGAQNLVGRGAISGRWAHGSASSGRLFAQGVQHARERRCSSSGTECLTGDIPAAAALKGPRHPAKRAKSLPRPRHAPPENAGGSFTEMSLRYMPWQQGKRHVGHESVRDAYEQTPDKNGTNERSQSLRTSAGNTDIIALIH
ncbi:hypothetical protein A1Q2_07227 [Trichosporon asahii var. asahii CBS 8904]|uniref:Uncharacterized protein n=2 Tax=Trichosporon asahii var. asahii TaxID=189963 RepID=K1VCF9_TRIAC|nr:hypothetical protein A1Q1_07694 [Trichosporon asahii var. asahii CBS 2479]EJT51099.1 hypothetical protein A1Q1_07694 [Trichosporon asahii var. asahii CBS 2479]EKC98490.1 hypothetical protein A1Q2_07227 [Trichosporon asahii var. asahii CBS 8904]